MAKDRRADGPPDKADKKDPEGLEDAHQRVGLREKDRPENERADGAVKQEVVPLDRGADGAGDQRPAQLRAVFSVREHARDRSGSGNGHSGVPLRNFLHIQQKLPQDLPGRKDTQC